MTFPRSLVLAACLLVSASPAVAQPASTGRDGNPPGSGQVAPERQATWLTPGQIDLAPGPKDVNPFTAFPGDMRRFFSGDNARYLGLASIFAVAVAPWDREGIRESQEHWASSPESFKAGNVAGSFLVQTGAALLTYGIGKVADSPETVSVGGDLLRAQLVSQVVVQGIKIATRRPRPDGSNNHSFPSGHTASAFATASVLKSHFGWKAGVPAYAFAAYVGASRMSANKHHLSDVLMGAAIGMASARTVTMDIGGAKFGLGVVPTDGGAAVTFTRK